MNTFALLEGEEEIPAPNIGLRFRPRRLSGWGCRQRAPNEALARSCAQFTACPKPDSLNEARQKLVAGLCCRSQRNKDETAAWARIARGIPRWRAGVTLDPSKPRLAQIEGTVGWTGAFPGQVTLGTEKY